MKDSEIATHLLVLHDQTGRIMAGVPVYDGYAGPVPLAGEGHEVARLDLPPAEYGRLAHEIDVAKLCTTHEVDVQRRALTARKLTTD